MSLFRFGDAVAAGDERDVSIGALGATHVDLSVPMKSSIVVISVAVAMHASATQKMQQYRYKSPRRFDNSVIPRLS